VSNEDYPTDVEVKQRIIEHAFDKHRELDVATRYWTLTNARVIMLYMDKNNDWGAVFKSGCSEGKTLIKDILILS